MKYLKLFEDFEEEKTEINKPSPKAMSKAEFVKLADSKYNKLYKYNHVNFKNLKTPIRIECKKHGPFNVTPLEHLSGKGCPDCSNFDPKKMADKKGYDITTPKLGELGDPIVVPKTFYQAKPFLTKNMIRRN